MTFKFKLMAGIAAVLVGTTTAAPAMTLEEALAEAYLNNPTLQAQRASLRATDESVPQAMSSWRPDIELTGSVEREFQDDNSSTGDARTTWLTPKSFDFTVTQNLFRGFRTEHEVSQAENNVAAARFRLQATEQTVMLNTVTSYMDVVRDAAVLELNKNNEQVLVRQLEATQDRFEVGELTRTDVSQAEARLARAVADRIQSEGDLEASRATFRNVVGVDAEMLVEPAPPIDLPAGRDEAVETALRLNANFNSTIFDEKAAVDNISVVKGELLPSVDLSFNYGQDRDLRTNGSFAEEANVNLSVTVPIYQQGTVYSELREARQRAHQERLEMDQARRDAIEDSTRGWESLVTAQAQIESFSSQIRAAEIALDGVQREATVGSRTVLDVLDAEQELLDAKVNLVRAKRDEIVAAFQLKDAIGQFSAAQIGLPVDLYDPDRNYNEVRDKWFGGFISGDENPENIME